VFFSLPRKMLMLKFKVQHGSSLAIVSLLIETPVVTYSHGFADHHRSYIYHQICSPTQINVLSLILDPIDIVGLRIRRWAPLAFRS
jgi:hypothetical protein